MPTLPTGLAALNRLPTVPRLPVVPDPLRRVRIPKDIDAVTTVGDEAEPEAGGVERRNVEAIWKATLDWYRSGVHPAMQVCVRRNGEVILDRAVGHSRGNGPRDGDDADKILATPDTPFCVYSTSKAITAFVVHKLCEKGVLHLEDPIAEHIPGYERHGKRDITIGHVLAHRAGVPNLPREALDLDNIDDHDYLREVLCDAKPVMLPGTQLAYHAVSGGFILGEVVRQVTGHGHPRRCSPRSSSSRSASAGPTTASIRPTSTPWPPTTSPVRARPRRSRPCSPARSGSASTTSSRRPTIPAT